MKKFLMIAIALMPLMLMAQARIGIVNSQQLFDLMPEKASAEAQLKVLSDKFHTEYLMLQRDFDKKYADYQVVAADASMPEAIKERRVQELQESDKKIREFQRRAADDIASRREALSNPINEKIQTAIQAAGRQANLDVVFDTAVTPVAYTGPNTVDITPMVKTILGL